jgi:putative DNA primase/helicase
MTKHFTNSPFDIALEYVRRGWNPLPLPFRTKAPTERGWQHRVIHEEDVPKYFNGQPQNIGVILGATSGGLTDVDLDCREAVELASWVLPKTPAIFGRLSNRASHWLYRTNLHDAAYGAEVKFQDPTRPVAKLTLLEVRIGGKDACGEVKGAQTVFPGSVHEGGEPITWEEPGEPAEVDGADLLQRARLLASCCLLARYWPGQGGRHEAALTLGGFFARAGMKPARAKQLVEAIARTAGDPEYKDRLVAAEDAATACREGKHAYGLRNLKKLFGEEVGRQIAEWLSYRAQSHEDAPYTDDAPETAPSSFSNDIVTEDSVAAKFVERHGRDLRYCHHAGSWYQWNGTLWCKDEVGRAFHSARILARQLASEQKERARLKASSSSFAGGVERFAARDPVVTATAHTWDRDLYLLGTPAGTVDLRTGELREARREDYITKSTAVAPSETADCPRWLKFLDEATGGDQALIEFMQQWCGYCLTGNTQEHALVFVHGDGGNGKGTFLNTATSILQDYATTAAMDTFIASKGDKHTTDVAMLHGARLVTASETEEGRAWAEARIKQLTGGDNITARFMRQDNFTFKPQFKLMIIGNHKPVLRNVDDAARRRFNIIPFVCKPKVPDVTLETKLKEEWPGILRWMIDGCLIWQQAGRLTRPKVVLDTTNEYFADQDLFRLWIEECCETGKPTLWDTSTNLFQSWKTWALANGEEPGTSKRFSQAMQRHHFAPFRKDKARGFRGIEVKPEPVSKHWSDME